MAQQNAVSITPAQFREQHSLSEGQFKRMKARVAESLDCPVSVQEGNRWFINPDAIPALEAALPTSRDQSAVPADNQPTTGAIVPSRPVELTVPEVVTPEIIELEAFVPDFTAQIQQAALEVQHSNQVSNGNQNLINQVELQAAVQRGIAQAHAIHAATEKAKQAALAQLQQQQLTTMGLGQSVPATAPDLSTEPTAKKQQ